MTNNDEQAGVSYVSKAERQAFEKDPLNFLVKKAEEVDGNFDKLSDEERWLIGALTNKLLRDELKD